MENQNILVSYNETVQTIEGFKKLNTFYFKRQIIYISIICTLLLISAVYLMIVSDFLFIGIIYIVFAVGAFTYTLLKTKKSIKKNINDNINKYEGIVNRYYFYYDHIEIYSEVEKHHKSSFKYSVFLDTIETNEYIFMFISSKEAFIISKDSFFDNGLNNCITLLKENVKRYRIKK